MRIFWQVLGVVLLNAGITFGLLRYFVLSQQITIDTGEVVERNIVSANKEVMIATGAHFSGNIILQKGNIFIQDDAKIWGDITVQEGIIRIGKSVEIYGSIHSSGVVHIGAYSIINGNVDQYSELHKHSDAQISGILPSLYVTSNYPDFLKYFDALPEEHKNNLGYIYLTRSNMAIRGKDIPANQYFKAIYYYNNQKLSLLDMSDMTLIQQHYENTKDYVNKISDARARRYDIAFTTLPHAFDRKKADVYISSHSVNSELFIHEFGHVQDFAHDYIDYHFPTYPYREKKNAITEYGKFHKGEDFAEGYRYYVLHNHHLQNMAKGNTEIQEKYNYFKTIVFKGYEYLS